VKHRASGFTHAHPNRIVASHLNSPYESQVPDWLKFGLGIAATDVLRRPQDIAPDDTFAAKHLRTVQRALESWRAEAVGQWIGQCQWEAAYLEASAVECETVLPTAASVGRSQGLRLAGAVTSRRCAPAHGWVRASRVIATSVGETIEELAKQAAVHPNLAFADLLDRPKEHFCGLRLVHHPVCAPYHRVAVLFGIVGAGEDEDAPRAALAQLPSEPAAFSPASVARCFPLSKGRGGNAMLPAQDSAGGCDWVGAAGPP